MIAFDRVKDLAKKRNKNLKQVAIDLGFSENYFYTWKKQDPSGTNLLKVANFFNVSIDYLLGRTEIPALNSEQKDLLIAEGIHSVISSEDDKYLDLFIKFSKLDKEELAAVEQLIDTMIKKKA